MYLRKAQAGNAPGYEWTEDGQVIEVEDELAVQLLRIPDGGFSEALPTEPEAPPAPEPASAEESPKPKRVRDDKGRLVKKTEIAE